MLWWCPNNAAVRDLLAGLTPALTPLVASADSAAFAQLIGQYQRKFDGALGGMGRTAAMARLILAAQTQMATADGARGIIHWGLQNQARLTAPVSWGSPWVAVQAAVANALAHAVTQNYLPSLPGLNA